MLAFVFPGQGSQAVGMGKALAARFPSAARVFEEADAALGRSISRLMFDGPEDELRLTANCQPAILTCSLALHRVLDEETELVPDVVLGHSLGEITALCAAGALSLADAVRLVRRRGELMQEAVPDGVGAMAAVSGLERAAVEALCREAAGPDVVAVSNLNAPGQVVISGHTRAVDRAGALAREKGGLVKRLEVSAPFHTELMRPAAERFREALSEVPLARPACPVISNVDAKRRQDPAEIAESLVRQIAAPVRWEECVRAANATAAIEIGATGVLGKMIERIDPALDVASASGPEAIDALVPRARGRVPDGAGLALDLGRYTRTWRREGWTLMPNGVRRRGDGLQLVLPSGAEWRFDDPAAHGL